MPEQTPRTARERAYADYEAVRDTILNGNTGFEALRKALHFDVIGPIYGTTFTFSSSMNGFETGLMDDGSVLCPTVPALDQNGELTIVASYGGETVKIVEPVTVLSLRYDEQPYVSGTMTSAMGATVDLTAEGTKDWAQFNADDVDNYAKKNTENTITGLRRLVEGGVDHATDMPLSYVASDAKDTQPTSKACITSRGTKEKRVSNSSCLTVRRCNMLIYMYPRGMLPQGWMFWSMAASSTPQPMAGVMAGTFERSAWIINFQIPAMK